MLTKKNIKPGMQLIRKRNDSSWTVKHQCKMTGIWVITDGERDKYLMDYDMAGYKIVNASISPFEAFKAKFFRNNLAETMDELRYKYEIIECARTFETLACKIIIHESLPLTAHLEIWESRGIVREISLVIQPVPEEYSFADEVQDDERYGRDSMQWMEWPY